MIAAPDGAADTHLEVLSKLMTLLMDASFANKLIEANTPEEFLAIIDEKEAAKDKEEAAAKPAEPSEEVKLLTEIKDILASQNK